MEILIKENAASNYVRRCYKGMRPDAVGLHSENVYNVLKNLEGKWVEVETEHLFRDQFNIAPVEGVTELGIRIYMAEVAEIKDDVRKGLKKCVHCFGYDHNEDGVCDVCEQAKYLVPLL